MPAPLQWLASRDRDLAALRRAGRAAIVMPGMFAVGDKLIGSPALATFAAFGSFAMLLLIDFGGPLRERLQAQVALGLAGCALVCLGTLASQDLWIASLASALVGFAVIFSGVVSSVLAGASTSLLLAFILPVTLPGGPSSVGDRVAGWAMAAGASVLAVGLLWPTPTRGPLRAAAASACRALGVRLRAEVAYEMSAQDRSLELDRDLAIEQADSAVSKLHGVFLATPNRPTSLNTPARTLVRLVDEVSWLNAIVVQSAHSQAGVVAGPAACAVGVAAAAVLERGADLLELTGGERACLQEGLDELAGAVSRLEDSATITLPVSRVARGAEGSGAEQRVRELVSSLDPSFRAHELGYAVSLIGRNIELTAAAERRSWLERLLGRQPDGIAGTVSAAQERATAHLDRNSVWLHNSVRGAAGLGLAVFVANQTGVQHSFWVVLGTLSVLRSNALNTGQSVLRGLLGTVVGFVLGAGILLVIGTNPTLLWFLLPPAILIAGIAPAAISFAAGQAAFTLTLVILFNIIQPVGWRVGLLRIEDIALGCGVSLAVGVLFWPRGAAAALRQALADAYTASADYLAGAVDFGMLCCGFSPSFPIDPATGALRAAAAARRLDDAFRSYLAERGAKPVPLAEVSSLMTGVGGLRLAADAVLALWEREQGAAAGDRSAARLELLGSSEVVRGWYEELARSLRGGEDAPPPLPHDELADGRLIEAVRADLGGEASATAVRMIWTAEHLDAVRRMQEVIVGSVHGAREPIGTPP